jgi:hypothetical protein
MIMQDSNLAEFENKIEVPFLSEQKIKTNKQTKKPINFLSSTKAKYR